MKKILFSATTFMAVISLVLAACGDDNDSEGASSAEKPLIVVTTNILGDVVTNMVGDSFDVETIMPPGSDPHDFQASAQQVQTMMSADLLVVNGANFEEGMLDVIENAQSDGVMIFEATSVISQLEGSDDHGDHGGRARGARPPGLLPHPVRRDPIRAECDQPTRLDARDRGPVIALTHHAHVFDSDTQ